MHEAREDLSTHSPKTMYSVVVAKNKSVDIERAKTAFQMPMKQDKIGRGATFKPPSRAIPLLGGLTGKGEVAKLPQSNNIGDPRPMILKPRGGQ